MNRHRVIGSLYYVKIRIQDRREQSGGYLADTAAEYLDYFTVLIAGCLLITFFSCRVTNNCIVGEGFTRQDNLSVAGRCCKRQIVNTAAGSACCA